MGALQLSPFRDVAAGLGYPAYFMSILGVWYASAGLILVALALHRVAPDQRLVALACLAGDRLLRGMQAGHPQREGHDRRGKHRDRPFHGGASFPG